MTLSTPLKSLWRRPSAVRSQERRLPGNTVIVTIGGNQYNATVQSDLSWSVSVPANAFAGAG
ncbi:hypothetical protein O5707_07245 [Escherichia coli]|nr:hypothetical protein [Escherichia coli]